MREKKTASTTSFFQKALFYEKMRLHYKKNLAWRALHGIGRNTMVKLECVEEDIFQSVTQTARKEESEYSQLESK